jgi:hypothetical protein
MRSEARGVAYYSIPAPDISLLCLALFLGLGHACMVVKEEVGCLDKTHQTNNLGDWGCFGQARSDDVDVAAY